MFILPTIATGYWTATDYGSTPIYCTASKDDKEIYPNDRKILRILAEEVARISNNPTQKEKIKLWIKHNSLGQTRPLIFCDPENGWNEIISEDKLKCKAELAKHWEMVLRKEIFWGEKLCDDKPIEAKFNISYVHTESGWGVNEKFQGGIEGGSYTWEPGLKKYSDIKKLRFPKIEVDYEATEFIKELANDVFGDLLKVGIVGKWWWSTGLSSKLVLLRGLQQVMIDMITDPKFVCSILEILKEGVLSIMDYLESQNILSLNNESYGGPGGFNYTKELPKKDFINSVRLIDLWGFSENQETVGISPNMFEKLIFPYQIQIQEKFGLNSYGCCEPLDKRWEIIKNIPRLRKVSVSPWADKKVMANNLSDNYCYVLKPHPVNLAVKNIDKKKVRDSLREAFEITKDCRVEVFMADTHTIGKNPQNVIDWVKIAKDEAERIAS